MWKKKEKHKNKFRLPYLKLRYQILIYVFAIFVGGGAIVCNQISSIPVFFRTAISGIAFISLFLAILYLFQYFFKDVNRLVDKVIRRHPILDYLSDNYREQTFLFAMPGLIISGLFALFNGFVGIEKFSAWYISLAVYYGLLCVMRFRFVYFEFLYRKKMCDEKKERQIFSQCGYILIIMSIALCGLVILIVHKGNGRSYPVYITYAIAVYTFMKMAAATGNMIKARRFKSLPVIGMRNIGYADALVSVLSLQTAMFAAFDDKNTSLRMTMNGITGTVVCVVVVILGITMVYGSRKLKKV